MSEWTFNRVNSGDTILERYDVISVLGESEIGVSCLVNDRKTNQNYVFRQLAFECTPERIEEIRAVVENLKKLNHKSVASLYDFVTDGSTGYILMEYIDGGNAVMMFFRVTQQFVHGNQRHELTFLFLPYDGSFKCGGNRSLEAKERFPSRPLPRKP